MAPVKFYHHYASAPSRLVFLTFKNLDLDAEYITVDIMNNGQLAPEFVKINPQHTVPTIDDNGFILWESRAIATYLVSTKDPGSTLYPTDVQKRSIVDARLYLDHQLHVTLEDIIYPLYTYGAKEIPQDDKEKVCKILGNLNIFLEGQEYAAGNELTIADLALLATISTYDEFGANINKFKNIAAWYKRLETIPGYQENLEGAQFVGKFLKSMTSLSGTWDDITN